MSIQHEIERINSNISSAYGALEEIGGDIPEKRNSDNLPSAIKSVSAVFYDELAKKQDKITGIPGQIVGIGDDGAAKATVYPSNDNLLINWYLADPINQRGQTEYTGTGYNIDCWHGKYTGSDGMVSVVNPGTKDGCVSLYRPAYNAHINQNIENPQQLAGKMITCSILYKNELGGKTHLMMNAKFGSNENLTTIKSASGVSVDYEVLSCSVVVPEGITELLVNIESTNAKKSFIRAAKLELGSEQTLAHKEDGAWALNDPPPNKALELLKCQKYLFKIVPNSYFWSLRTGSSIISYMVPVPTPMSKTPTLVGSSYQIYDAVNGKTFTDGFTIECANYGNFVKIIATKSSHGLTDTVFIPKETMFLDANL